MVRKIGKYEEELQPLLTEKELIKRNNKVWYGITLKTRHLADGIKFDWDVAIEGTNYSTISQRLEVINRIMESKFKTKKFQEIRDSI